MKMLNLIAGNFSPLFYKLFNYAHQIILSQGVGKSLIVTGFLEKTIGSQWMYERITVDFDIRAKKQI